MDHVHALIRDALLGREVTLAQLDAAAPTARGDLAVALQAMREDLAMSGSINGGRILAKENGEGGNLSMIFANVLSEDLIEREVAKDRPSIDAGCQNLALVTELCWSAIEQGNTPEKYFRFGDVPCRLERDDRDLLMARTLTAERLRHELAELAAWQSWTKKAGWKPAKPPLDVMKNILATPSDRIPLPRLERIVEIPIFGADGTLHSRPGYDSKTFAYLDPAAGFVIPEVSEAPSGEEIAMAREHIEEPIDEMPFVGPSDKANALGLAVLPYARNMIDGPTPMHSVEAPAAGSGKNLLVGSLLNPSVGENIEPVAETSSDEEWRKRLTSQFRSARPVALLDNVNRPLTSGVLACAIAATSWGDRLLGQNEMVFLPVRNAWIMTANNPTMSTEIARRCVRIRIDPRIDRPWLRDGFRIADLPAWVREHRGELVWAALTLIQAWIVAGKPAPRVKPLGTFEQWTQVIGGVLENAGIHGFLDNAIEFYELADAEGAAWRAFIDAWWDKYADSNVGAADLFPLVEGGDYFDLDGTEKAQKTKFGRMLVKKRDQVVGNFLIKPAGTTAGAKRWRLQEVDHVVNNDLQ
jgi:hypothetical protein